MPAHLSEHFHRSEFACKCGCGFDTVDAELLQVLNRAREYWQAAVTVTSGCRCHTHNAAVGGAASSHHLIGRAADIAIKGVTSKKVVAWLDTEFQEKYGIGLYPRWVHIDTRKDHARW